MTVVAVALGVTFVTGSLVLTDTSQRLRRSSSGKRCRRRPQCPPSGRVRLRDGRRGTARTLSPQIRDRVAPSPESPRPAQVNGRALITLTARRSCPAVHRCSPRGRRRPSGPIRSAPGRHPSTPARSSSTKPPPAPTTSPSVTGCSCGPKATGTFTVVGLIGFGDRDGLPDSTLALVDGRSARHLLQLGHGSSEVDVVAADGVAPTVLAERIQHELGNRYEVGLARDTAAASAAAAKTQVRYIAVALLVLAGAALLIGAFLIANTFSIMVTQRLRELALLRAAGATGRQVFASVMGEAVVVGAAGGLLGLVAGVGAALGLRALVANLGVTVTDSSLVITGRTILVAVTVGLGVTLLAAVGPARRAARVAPVAALRESTSETAQPASRARKVVGLVAADLWCPRSGWGCWRGLPGRARCRCRLAHRRPGAPRPGVRAGGGKVRGPSVDGSRCARRWPVSPQPARPGGRLPPSPPWPSAWPWWCSSPCGASIKTSMRDSYREVVSANLVVESARGEMLGGLVPAAYRTTAASARSPSSKIRYGHWKDPHTGTVSAITVSDPLRSAAGHEPRPRPEVSTGSRATTPALCVGRCGGPRAQ